MNIYYYLLLSFIIFIILKYFVWNSSQKKAPKNKKGALILKPSKFFVIISYSGFVLSIIIIIISFLGTVKDINDFFIMLSMFLFFTIFSLYLLLFGKNNRVEADNTKVKYFTLFNKSKEIYWKDIKKTTFQKNGMHLVLHSSDQKIKVNFIFIGFWEFVDLMKEKLKKEIYTKTLEEIKYLKNN